MFAVYQNLVQTVNGVQEKPYADGTQNLSTKTYRDNTHTQSRTNKWDNNVLLIGTYSVWCTFIYGVPTEYHIVVGMAKFGFINIQNGLEARLLLSIFE